MAGGDWRQQAVTQANVRKPGGGPSGSSDVSGRAGVTSEGGQDVAHIVDILQAGRTATWFGHQPEPEDGVPVVPGSADAARSALEDAYGVWRRRLASLSQEDLERPMGPIAGPYATDDGTAFALHILDELIHHGAEAELSITDDQFQADVLGWAKWFQQPEAVAYLQSL